MQQGTRADRVLSAVLAEQHRQGISLKELAKRWGVTEGWAIARFSGHAGLTGSELEHIARALSVPVEQLAGV